MPNFSGLWTANQQFQAVGGSTWPSFPGAPTSAVATATSGTDASVAFTAPSSTGYPATITGYIVTSSPGGLTGTGASSPISVTGLTADTAYTFTVRAINATGTGPSSAASNSVTPVNAFVEDLFSTYTYTGTGATQTITNGIDLATKGGLVWCKARSVGNHGRLFDTARGVQKAIYSSLTSEEAIESTALTAFNAVGFTLGSNDNINGSGATNVSWTFRKQPKFFDIVTYTGNGTTQNIAHNLGSVPGCIIVKSTSQSSSNWFVYHRSLGVDSFAILNLTNAAFGYNGGFSDITSTSFGVANSNNGNGATFVAYLFAHDAGGFGLTSTDNVISCGSVTTDGSGVGNVTLGYEPQWILTKQSGTAGNWRINDTMRGLSVTSGVDLRPNLSDAESNYGAASYVTPNATGFSINSLFGTSQPVIYIAIRRGPMKVPTLGTQVYQGLNATGGASYTNFNVGMDSDLILGTALAPYNYGTDVWSRLINQEYNDTGQLHTYSTNAVAPLSGTLFSDLKFDVSGGYRARYMKGNNTMMHLFKRAPGFFDVVAYTGNNTARTINHNLGVVPEMMIFKNRTDASTGWITALTVGGLSWTSGNFLRLELTNGTLTNTAVLDTTPTATLFSIPSTNTLNYTASNYVAFLFATCAGVSKVGSYTGTGTTQTINCGFTGGARFVLIKRTDSTGDWYVWDTTRGIIAGNDPYFLLNSSAIEVTNTDYIDAAATGFELSSTAPAAINANGGTYIFLAIA